MTRFLHTSDWHFGVSLETAPRDAEHRRFTAWLLDEVRERKVEVLLISGDVYHYSQPSAAAQTDFFEFIAQCEDVDSLQHIVVIAGNHDSPSRLEAPRRVLKRVGVTVVGNLDVKDPDAAITPIIVGDSCVAVVVAVPYMSEARLGISTTDKDPTELRRTYASRFAELHDHLLAQAKERYPDAPVLAMGHLTCTSADSGHQDGDFYTPIHSFASVHGLPTSVFATGFDYVGLGHIHRCHQVGDRQIWYSGSPVPVSVVEARTPRYVLQVDIADSVRTRKVRVPRWRDVFEVEGTSEDVKDLIRSLEWETELPPYLYVDVILEEGQHQEVDRYQNLIARHFEDDQLPRIVRFRTQSQAFSDSEDPTLPPADLRTLRPEEVFGRMYRARHGVEAPESVEATFRELMATMESP